MNRALVWSIVFDDAVSNMYEFPHDGDDKKGTVTLIHELGSLSPFSMAGRR